jgi:hypothetical protein
MVCLEGKIINLRGCQSILVDSDTIKKNFLHMLSNVPEKYSQQKFMRDGTNKPIYSIR